jgi:hypothetical protein
MSANDLSRHTGTRTATVRRRTVAAARRRSRVPIALVVLAVAAAALAAGCSRDSAPPGPGSTTADSSTSGPPDTHRPSLAVSAPASSTSRPAGPSAHASGSSGRPRSDPAPTAAGDLAAYFAAAEVADARIRAATAAVNRGIGPTTAHVARSTRTLILASSPHQAAKAIPAGMPPDLQRAVLLVHSELVARSAAFNDVHPGQTIPLTDPESVRMLGAFRAGSVIAHRYRHDLAAARALAQATPPLRMVRSDSRQAAELALQIAVINGENNGCGSAGGYLYTAPRPIRWTTIVTDYGRFDGTISGIMFTATYNPASGWKVELNAC